MKFGGKQQAKVTPTRDPETCRRCGSNGAREMHLDDKANERRAKAEAAANIDSFFTKHQAEFKALVQTYGDGKAESLLEALREQFWTATPAGSDNFEAPE